MDFNIEETNLAKAINKSKRLESFSGYLFLIAILAPFLFSSLGLELIAQLIVAVCLPFVIAFAFGSLGYHSGLSHGSQLTLDVIREKILKEQEK